MPATCEILFRAKPELNHNQDPTLDAVVCRDVDMDRAPLHPAVSQNLDEDFLIECALGNAEFCAIRDAWQSSHPILVLPITVFDDLVYKNAVTLNGSLADVAKAN
jgi:hypothetical protein